MSFARINRVKNLFKSLVVITALICAAPAFADGKANVTVGKVKIAANSKKDHNVSFSKSGNLFIVSISASKFVISSNPSTASLLLSMTFDVEEDFVSGQTYDLVPPANELNADGFNFNALVIASQTKGSQGWAVTNSNAADSRASGTLKVIKYDSSTGEFKGIIKAKFTPSVVTTINGGNSVQSETTKAVPVNIVFNAELD